MFVCGGDWTGLCFPQFSICCERILRGYVCHICTKLLYIYIYIFVLQEAVAIQLEEERLVKIRDVLKELPKPHYR